MSTGSRSCPRPLRFFFSSRRRHTRCLSDWSSDVCSSDLECRTGNGRRRDNRQGDPNPFAVEEKKELVVSNGSAQTAPKMIHGRSGLVIPRCRISKRVCRVEYRAIQKFVKIPMKLIPTGFRDVVSL